ncbi:MAG TPA: zinc ribbon domain-containing protein [Baekduia sp.]|nr:zinc ribbon domain-containing protein [Baekduia sp.]
MTSIQTSNPVAEATPEPCTHCGTPLAADQRYCLNCGERRAQARLDFIDILSEDSGHVAALPAAGVAAPPLRNGAESWIRANAGILGLCAALLLTLAGGIAIGNALGGSDPQAAAAKPQVIKVESGAATTADDAAADDAEAEAADSGDPAESADEPAPAAEGTNADGKSADEIEKAVDKGEPLSTGSGAAPKTDDKAAGGGSDFETIE